MPRNTEISVSVWAHDTPPRVWGVTDDTSGVIFATGPASVTIFFTERSETPRLTQLTRLRDALAAHIAELTPRPVTVSGGAPDDAA